MTTPAPITVLSPRWMGDAGTMLRMQALVRTHCTVCGTLLRVELEDIVARHGPAYTLFDRLERCRMVGCVGSTVYRASRGYGRDWVTLLRDPDLVARFATLPTARTAFA